MRTRSLVLVTMSLLLIGCGQNIAERAMERAIEEKAGEDAHVDIDVNSESMTFETDEGTATLNVDELPENWPSDVPVYPETAINMASAIHDADGSPLFSLLLTSKDAVAEIKAFYQRELPANGWSMDARVTMDAGGVTMIGATKGDQRLSIMIGETGEEATITIGVGKDNL